MHSKTSPETQLCLQTLRSLIKDNSEYFDHFEEFLDDAFLIQFIYGKNHDTAKAFDCLKHYIYVRTVKYADFMLTLRPSNSKTSQLLDCRVIRPLKNRDELGRLVFLDQISSWDPYRFSGDDCVALWSLVAEEFFRTAEHVCQAGVVVIFDFDNYSFQHARQIQLRHVVQALNLFVNSYPMKYKGGHFVNSGRLCNFLLSVIKPLLKKKFRDRLHIHSGQMDTLHDHVPVSILPKSLGGLLSNDEAFDLEFEQKIKANEDYYERFAEKVKAKRVELL